MSDREDSPVGNGDSPGGDDRSNRSGSRQESDREGSHHGSENGHSPRPVGRSRSRSHSDSRRYARSKRSHSGSRRDSRHSPSDKGRRGKRHSSRSPMSSRRRHQGDREDPPAGRCLGIFGLSIYTQERDLKDVLSKYGPIEDVQIVYDAQTGRSRGFAFVYFENKNDAAEAKERCNGIDIDGRKIRVDFSITQRAHTPTPGIYMGKPTHSNQNSYSPRYRGGSGGGGGGGGGYRGYRGGGGGGGGGHGGYERRRSPSPSYTYGRDRRYGGGRSRSRSHSPRRGHYR